jgi:hypothetical protein
MRIGRLGRSRPEEKKLDPESLRNHGGENEEASGKVVNFKDASRSAITRKV